MHVLHTFTGAPAADSRNRRDWTLTTVWALSMDAVAAGLIVMVLGSYVMWFRLRAKRLGGIVALLLGFITCGAFIGGLRWLLLISQADEQVGALSSGRYGDYALAVASAPRLAKKRGVGVEGVEARVYSVNTRSSRIVRAPHAQTM